MNATVTLPLSEIDSLRENLRLALEAAQKAEQLAPTMKVKVIEIRTVPDYSMIRGPYGEVDRQFTKREEVISIRNLDEVTGLLREKEEERMAKVLEDLRDVLARRDNSIKEFNGNQEKLQKRIAELEKELERKVKEYNADERVKAVEERFKELQQFNEQLSTANLCYFDEHKAIVAAINSLSWWKRWKFIFTKHEYPSPYGPFKP